VPETAPGEAPDPEGPLSEDERSRLRTEIQHVATRAVSLLLAARGWSQTEAARRCGWDDPYRISNSLERRAGWTLEKLAILSAAAGINVGDLLRLAYDSIHAERDAARRRFGDRQDGEALLGMLRALPREERERILCELEGE